MIFSISFGVENMESGEMNFKNGIQVGNMFWIMGAQKKKHGSILDETDPINPELNARQLLKTRTMLWFSRRGRWRRGPDLKPDSDWFVI